MKKKTEDRISVMLAMMRRMSLKAMPLFLNIGMALLVELMDEKHTRQRGSQSPQILDNARSKDS